MSPEEKADFQSFFPRLDVNTVVVTGEETPIYNCISWTVGITDRWLWPGINISDFDRFYRSFGFLPASNGPIAAWATSISAMTHGCVSGSVHGPRWESKCGESLRIQHGLSELEGDTYGRVVVFYAQELQLQAPSVRTLEQLTATSIQKAMQLADNDRAILKREVSEISSELQNAYRQAFIAWKSTWFSGSLAINSNPLSRARGPEFDRLVALGPQIVPLLIESLIEDDNFLALSLYDLIQSDSNLIVQYESDDPRLLEGEQGRAKRVVKAWLSR